MGETPQLLPVLFGLYSFHLLRAEHKTARELAEQIFHLAQSQQDPALHLWPHCALGLVLHEMGELTSARAHLEQGIALYDPQQHRPHSSQVLGQDPKVTCLSYISHTLWRLGYLDQARQRSAEVLTLAQELSHPFSLAFALGLAAGLNQFLGDVQADQAMIEALLTLSHEQGFPFWLTWGAVRRGYVLSEQGQSQEGIALMRQGMTALQAIGSALGRSWLLALLAEAYGKAGQAEEGLRVLAEGFSIVGKTGERGYEADLYRLKGELTLQSQVESHKSKVEEAEACFLKAIEIARRQSAKSLELRAIMSLSRLWQRQGKHHEAHKMLSEIYSWFTEGFDTKDLQEAKALLDTLS